MKLKAFTPETVSEVGRTGEPTISLNRNDGRINFNKTAVELLDLQPNNYLQFVHDEDEPGDWYLTFCSKENGFEVLDVTPESTPYVKNPGLVYDMIQTLNNEAKDLYDQKKVVKLRLATQPVELNGKRFYALITHAYKKSRR